MENLWKKETGRAEYVDLFASVKDSSLDMHVELCKTMKIRKDNQISTEWRAKGNELFRQENWMEAMKCYDKSLCFAEVGSENEALAYSNRSACFFHLNNFPGTLKDIELTMNSNLPDRLRPKLEQRRAECLAQMPMVSRSPVHERVEKFKPKLSYDADENYQCMANVVEIKSDDIFGRHLVAKCDIPVGKTVLVEEDIPQIGDGMCNTCLSLPTNLIACPDCPNVIFCSVDCKNRNQIHKWECGTMSSTLPLDLRFLIKTVLIAITSFPSVDELMQFVEDALLEDPKKLPLSLKDPKSKYHFFFKLNTSALNDRLNLTNGYKAYNAVLTIPKVCAVFDSERKKRFLMHLVSHHILIADGNGFGDEETQCIANVVSLVNHSCVGNVFSSHFGNKVFCVTGRLIKAGEQLFLNYHNENIEKMSSKERKSILKSRWGFDCKCEKCEPTRVPLDQKMITSDPCYKYVLQNHDNIHDFANIIEKCVQFLNKYGRSPWSSEIEFVSNVYGRYLGKGLRN